MPSSGAPPFEPDGRAGDPLALTRATSSLALGALQTGMLAIASTLFVVLVFDGKPSDMVLGVVVGTVVWGIAEYLVAVREMVPSGDLGPPTAAFVETPPRPRPSAGGAALIGFAIAACFLLAWLADAWDLGAAFVPGQFAGYAAARAVGGLATRRWERARGKRILVDLVGDEPVLYATD